MRPPLLAAEVRQCYELAGEPTDSLYCLGCCDQRMSGHSHTPLRPASSAAHGDQGRIRGESPRGCDGCNQLAQCACVKIQVGQQDKAVQQRLLADGQPAGEASRFCLPHACVWCRCAGSGLALFRAARVSGTLA